jgi:hypothetical protein
MNRNDDDAGSPEVREERREDRLNAATKDMWAERTRVLGILKKSHDIAQDAAQFLSLAVTCDGARGGDPTDDANVRAYIIAVKQICIEIVNSMNRLLEKP